ncbi:MAG: hypothetical protein ABR540_01925 [Acidimicrobiales bacterium]
MGVVALALVATGCGDDDDAKPGPATSTRFPPTVPVNNDPLAEGEGACGLLNRGEVEATVSLPVNPGTGVRTKTNESCTWKLRSGANQFVALFASESGVPQYENAEKQLAQVEQQSGVGDRAFVAGDTAYALKGGRLVIVQVLTSQPVPARKQAALKLITGAISRG